MSTIEHLDVGLTVTSESPRLSVAVVYGQHGDEFAGLEAGTQVANLLAATANGCTLALSDGSGHRVAVDPLPIDGVSWLVAPLYHVHLWGQRRVDGRPGTGSGVSGFVPDGGDIDLNRTWPHGSQVAPVWKAIQEMTRPVLVVDLHSTWRPRRYVYLSGHSRQVMEPLLPPGWPVRDVPKPASSGALEDVAREDGCLAITVEVTERSGAPGIVACALIRSLVTGLVRTW